MQLRSQASEQATWSRSPTSPFDRMAAALTGFVSSSRAREAQPSGAARAVRSWGLKAARSIRVKGAALKCFESFQFLSPEMAILRIRPRRAVADHRASFRTPPLSEEGQQ